MQFQKFTPLSYSESIRNSFRASVIAPLGFRKRSERVRHVLCPFRVFRMHQELDACFPNVFRTCHMLIECFTNISRIHIDAIFGWSIIINYFERARHIFVATECLSVCICTEPNNQFPSITHPSLPGYDPVAPVFKRIKISS